LPGPSSMEMTVSPARLVRLKWFPSRLDNAGLGVNCSSAGSRWWW
jgi:hypothetical protein